MILGDTCTRRCGFCNVKTGKPTWNDPLEPLRVARCVARMGLRHAVITSVDRDDLPDYGASVWCGVIRSIRMQAPDTKIECLTPDFRGEEMPLARVIAERPDVFNHNVEVAPRLYPVARRGSTWKRSLRVLPNALELGEGEVATKSGLMVGLGETHEEMVDAFGDLREAGVRSSPSASTCARPSATCRSSATGSPRSSRRSRRAAYDWASSTSPPARSCARATTPTSTSSRTARASARSPQPDRVSGRQRLPLPPDAPAARQHPDVADAGRHVRADRGEHPRLLPLAAGRAVARRPELGALHLQPADWAAIPYEITHPGDQVQIAPGCGAPTRRPGLTPFTAMFMHGGLLHLGGNMLFLWIFGNNVEDSMGPVKFVVFYLLGGLAAMALQTIRPELAGPDGRRLRRDRRRARRLPAAVPAGQGRDVIFIVFFFTILELPALLVLGIWFLQQALFGYFDLAQPRQGGGVAYFAHIGGFVFGLLAVRLFASRRRVERQTELHARDAQLDEAPASALLLGCWLIVLARSARLRRARARRGARAAPRRARDGAARPAAGLRHAPLAGGGTAPSPLAVRLDARRRRSSIGFKKPPRSALLFDLDTGRVLWRREPTRVLPIASLTKMMTALVVVERVPAGRQGARSPTRRCATRLGRRRCCRAASGSASTRCCTA